MPSNPVSNFIASRRFLPAAFAFAAPPVGFIIYKHVSWEHSPTAKKRMATQHAIFWSTMAAGVIQFHMVGKLARQGALKGWRALLMSFSAGMLPVLGFLAGVPVVAKLWPPKAVQHAEATVPPAQLTLPPPQPALPPPRQNWPAPPPDFTQAPSAFSVSSGFPPPAFPTQPPSQIRTSQPHNGFYA